MKTRRTERGARDCHNCARIALFMTAMSLHAGEVVAVKSGADGKLAQVSVNVTDEPVSYFDVWNTIGKFEARKCSIYESHIGFTDLKHSLLSQAYGHWSDWYDYASTRYFRTQTCTSSWSFTTPTSNSSGSFNFTERITDFEERVRDSANWESSDTWEWQETNEYGTPTGVWYTGTSTLHAACRPQANSGYPVFDGYWVTNYGRPGGADVTTTFQNRVIYLTEGIGPNYATSEDFFRTTPKGIWAAEPQPWTVSEASWQISESSTSGTSRSYNYSITLSDEDTVADVQSRIDRGRAMADLNSLPWGRWRIIRHAAVTYEGNAPNSEIWLSRYTNDLSDYAEENAQIRFNVPAALQQPGLAFRGRVIEYFIGVDDWDHPRVIKIHDVEMRDGQWVSPVIYPTETTEDGYVVLRAFSPVAEIVRPHNILAFSAPAEAGSNTAPTEYLAVKPTLTLEPQFADANGSGLVFRRVLAESKTLQQINLSDSLRSLRNWSEATVNWSILPDATAQVRLWVWTDDGSSLGVWKLLSTAENLAPCFGNPRQFLFGEALTGGQATVRLTIDINGNQVYDDLKINANAVAAALAVDANRDGIIEMPPEDPTMSYADATTATLSYRFWVNDDDDQMVGSTTKDIVPVSWEDWKNKQPDSARDMEDFARLWINAAGLTASLKPKSDGSADLYLGLKWADTGTTTPGIRVFRHDEADGGTHYLSDQSVAQSQSSATCILDENVPRESPANEGVVTGSAVYVLRPWVFSALSDSQPVSHLLFEGCKVGRGQLKVVVLRKQDGKFTTVSEGPGVWLDIMNIKSMYERVVATTGGPLSENGVDYTIPIPSDFTGPDDNNVPHPTMGWKPNPLGYPYEPDPAEAKTYIIYVHGWRWSPEKANNRTETVFKRLWHLGYKGRLAALRWPTFYGGPDDDDSEPAGLFTYNDSEYRAWKSGESLKQYVNQLPSGYTRHAVAHSMGNIVTGAALKSGMSVANYVMLNAAVPAMSYDESIGLRQTNWNYTTPNTDPDADSRALAYIGQFGTLNTNVVNFFLSRDTATLGLWELNNNKWRPQRYNLGSTGYVYDPSALVGQRLYVTFFWSLGRNLIDPHEAMPYACQSLTRTAGADGRTRGAIGIAVDMDASFGFDDEHGAEWDRNCQATRAFYVELMRTLQLPVQP